MKSFSKRVASFTMAAAMVLSLAAVPTTDAEAASYSLTKKTSITSSKTGKYYIKGVSKKQYVKVSVSGAAKSGVTVKTSAGKKLTSSTKLNGTGKTLTLKVTNKGVVGKSYKLTAKVYNSNNKVAKTLTSTTYVKNNKFTLSNSEVSVVEEQTATVTATAKYKYSTGTYTWATADANIATVADGVITGVNAGTTTVTVTRGNFTETVKVTVTEGPVKVTSATAKNARTIELAGRHLDKLTVKDVKISGYTVETIKGAEDGKTAVVTLGSALIPNKEETFEVVINAETVKFTVKYSTEASTVAVKDATYGLTSTAALTVLINGVETSLNELKANGYSTTFYAYKEDASGALQTNNNLFAPGTTFSSTSGVLNGANGIPAGVYKVKVVLVKGATQTSDYATITITDKQIYEQDIKEIELKSADLKSIYKISDNAFALKVGDTYTLTDVKTKTTYDVDASATLSKVLLKSDNTSVATISGGNKIVAHKSGTANITVTYGNLTKTLSLTVKTDGRGFATVKAPAPSKTVIGNNVSGSVYAVDNYGAYMVGQHIYVELPQNNTAVLGNVYTVSGNTTVTDGNAKSIMTDSTGSVTVSYTASSVAGAIATFNIYKGNASGHEGSLLATYNVTNSAMNASSYKLEVEKVVQYSADTNIDYNPLTSDDKIKIKLKKYYADVCQGAVSFNAVSGSTISYDDSVIKVTSGNSVVSNNSIFGRAGTTGIEELTIRPTGKAGSATIQIKDVTQNLVASISVTATNTVPGITDIKLASNAINYDVNTTIDYRNVLSVVPNKDNPEVPGVTFTDGKNYTVKLCTVAGSVTGYQWNGTAWVNTALNKGSLFIETEKGNLALGMLGFNKTVGGNNKYTLVTDNLAIAANQATSINFAMIKSSDTADGNEYDDIMNVLGSSIAVNSYK